MHAQFKPGPALAVLLHVAGYDDAHQETAKAIKEQTKTLKRPAESSPGLSARSRRVSNAGTE